MKNYYIYHISGIKIGCTVNIPHRMAEQGFTEWEILETHTDIYVASDREIELQKQYGLPVDTVPYWKSVENRHKWNNETRYELTSEECSIGGKNKKGKKVLDTSNMKAPKSKEHIENIRLANTGKTHTEERKRKISESIKVNPKIQCPHCDKPPMDPRNYSKWHGDNCKQKKG
mgnify:FL=1